MYLYSHRHLPHPTHIPSPGAGSSNGPDPPIGAVAFQAPAWSTRQTFVLSVMLGLRKGLKPIRGARRKIAQAIVEDLRAQQLEDRAGAGGTGTLGDYGGKK